MTKLIPDGYEPTVKERVVIEFERLIKEMVREDDNSPLFKTVLRSPPDEIEYRPLNGPYCFIEESNDDISGTQMYTELVVSRELSLIVSVRFQIDRQAGDDPFSVWNYFLGKLQETLLVSYKLNGRLFDLDEIQNAPEVISMNDNFLGGFIIFRAKYRHAKSNPKQMR
jgi:hypothetical protein